MNWTYMNKVAAWKEEYDEGLGMDIVKIQEEETKFNISFPLAYKEFLELSGLEFYASKVSTAYDHIDRSRAHQLLKEYQLEKLIKKDFWVVADIDDAFFYIHVDEGDNPPVYRLDCENYGDMSDEFTFGKIAETFEEWINKKIDNWEHEQQYL